MERNLTRSSKGWRVSSASSMTRRLNSIQLNSRLIYKSGGTTSVLPVAMVGFCCICFSIPGRLRDDVFVYSIIHTSGDANIKTYLIVYSLLCSITYNLAKKE